MKSFLKHSLVMGTLAASIGAASAEMTLDELDREISRLKQSIKSNSSHLDRLSVSGYVSVGLSTTDAPVDFEPGSLPSVSTETRTTSQSKAGMQFDYKINEKTSATVQLLADGANDFDVDLEYGFIKWDINENHALRFGRLRTPLYKYSDSINATYTQPWGAQPTEIYGLNQFNSINGVDYIGYFETGDFLHSVNIYGGTNNTDDGQLTNGRGIALQTEWNGFSARVNHLTTSWNNETLWRDIALGLIQGATAVCTAINEAPNFSIPVAGPGPVPVPAAGAANGCTATPVPLAVQFEEHALQLLTLQSLLPVEDLTIEFVTAGIEYNHSMFYVLGEWSDARITDIVGDQRSYYGTIGLNLPHNISPYFTVGKIETTDDEERAIPALNFIPGTATPISDSFFDRNFNFHQRSERIGVRWDATENVAVFADAERYHDFKGSAGQFNTEVSVLAAERRLNRSDEHYVYRLTVAARF